MYPKINISIVSCLFSIMSYILCPNKKKKNENKNKNNKTKNNISCNNNNNMCYFLPTSKYKMKLIACTCSVRFPGHNSTQKPYFMAMCFSKKPLSHGEEEG